MRSIIRCVTTLTVVALVSLVSFIRANEARAVGVLYSDPGWYNVYDGNSAYYHDPDGYNTDYNTGSPTNEPGGQGGQPALIDPGGCPADCSAQAIWQNENSHWDGSAPGDTLGGTPDPPWDPNKPFLGPAAPGGAGAFTEGSTTFLRIQDPGDPAIYGWPDKYSQLDPTKPKQEGGNKKIEFEHEMSRDASFSGRQDILDFGVTVSFRARIATAVTGPLDMYYDEDGAGPFPWPTDGIGYPISGSGRGMVMIQQIGAQGPSRLSFSLLDTNSINDFGVPTSTTGLVMNNRALGTGTPGSPDTNETDAQRLNVAEIPNAEMTDWHEFWITVKALSAPVDGNTHEVNVYMDGSLTPETFQVILGAENEAGNGSFLGMGLTSGSRHGAVDIDFLAYKEGVFAPTLGGLAGDFNSDGKVDAADYVLWRDNNGTSNALANDGGLGTPIGQAHYDLWRSHFGESSGSGSGVSLAAVPEPTSAILLLFACAMVGVLGRRRM